MQRLVALQPARAGELQPCSGTRKATAMRCDATCTLYQWSVVWDGTSSELNVVSPILPIILEQHGTLLSEGLVFAQSVLVSTYQTNLSLLTAKRNTKSLHLLPAGKVARKGLRSPVSVDLLALSLALAFLCLCLSVRLTCPSFIGCRSLALPGRCFFTSKFLGSHSESWGIADNRQGPIRASPTKITHITIQTY